MWITLSSIVQQPGAGRYCHISVGNSFSAATRTSCACPYSLIFACRASWVMPSSSGRWLNPARYTPDRRCPHVHFPGASMTNIHCSCDRRHYHSARSCSIVEEQKTGISAVCVLVAVCGSKGRFGGLSDQNPSNKGAARAPAC